MGTFVDQYFPNIATGLYVIAAALMAYAVAQFYSMGPAMKFVMVLLSLVAVLKTRINPLFINFGFHLAMGIIAMGIAAKTGGMALIGLVLAFALALGAVALIIFAVKELVVSLTGLFTLLIDSVDVLPSLAVSLYLLGSAFLFLGTSALIGSLGIFMGIAALTVMLALFKLTGTSMKDMFGAGDEILKIGTGILNLGNGLSALKSSISEIKSAIGEEGLFAASIEGGSSSIVMGEGVHVAKLFKNNKVTVDVKMPKIAMPEIKVVVKIGETELRDIIDQSVESRQGAVG